MTELDRGSTALENDAAAAASAFLLANYSFDVGCCTENELVERWLRRYPSDWMLLAVIEALYQGRYKAVSVEHILRIWRRRAQPIYHFSCEFKHLVFNQLPQHLKAEIIGTSEDSLAGYNQEVWVDEGTAKEEINSSFTAANATVRMKQPLDQPDAAKASIGFDAILEPLPAQPVSQTPALSKSEEERTPRLPLEVGKPNEMHIWGFSNPPIDQFTPANVAPELYAKLKAIARPSKRQAIAQPDKKLPTLETSNTTPEDSLSGKREDEEILPESRGNQE